RKPKTENRKPKTENRKLYTANSICLFSVTALNIPSVFIRLEAGVWERAMPANARQRRANEHQRRIGGFNNPNRDKNVTPTNPAQPLRFFRPIRSSPLFTKTNSIVWMTPNEWPGAWMPLGRVCSIGFGKRGSAGTRAREVGKEIPLLTSGRRGRAPHKLPRSGSSKSGCKPQKPSRSDGQGQRAALDSRAWPAPTSPEGWKKERKINNACKSKTLTA